MLIHSDMRRYLEHEKLAGDASVLLVDPMVVSCMRLQCDGEDPRLLCKSYCISDECRMH